LFNHLLIGIFGVMSDKSEKQSLRERYRRERRERYIPHDFLLLLDIPEIQSAQIIGSYFSINDEPSTTALNHALHQSGKTVALPVLREGLMTWRIWDGATIDLSQRIPEPTGDEIDPHTFDAMLVPALRVDRRGYRLGQGGGYFDRQLPTITAWTCALVHPDEISSSDLPIDEWDIPVRAFATPDIITRIR